MSRHEYQFLGNAARHLEGSAGPVSDAFIACPPFALGDAGQPIAALPVIMGPQGSAKTTAVVKKIIHEARSIPPVDGLRRYVIGVWRYTYAQLWNATIPSWNKIFPIGMVGAAFPGSQFTGARGRDAEHIINFEDGWGPVQIVARFRAYGDAASPDDLVGVEFTDCWLNEINTMPEELVTWLGGRVARDPPRTVLGRPGMIIGDCNAPDVLNFVYRDWIEDPKPGRILFRQPGGLDPRAENLHVVGRAYYLEQIERNKHKKGWVKRMVHNQPGFLAEGDVVFEDFDDERHVARQRLAANPSLPVLVGVDGGLTPAAVFMQETGAGPLNILAEVALERGDMKSLARAMLAVMAARFPGCEFVITCDPSMDNGADTEIGSDRARLAQHLGLKVEKAKTNDPQTRIGAMAAWLAPGGAGIALDPSCKGLRRGFAQTYAWHKARGSNEIKRVADSFDTHVMDAGCYAALLTGTAAARQRQAHQASERQRRRERAREAGRYNPFARQGAR